MSRMLWRASLRHLTRHPWQFGGSLLGVALGVAVVLSIDLANESARRGFALFAETTAGRATHQVVGGPGGVPEAVYARLRVEAGVRDAAPVVERDVVVAGDPGIALHLMGIDPFAEGPFRAFTGADAVGGEGGLGPLLTRPGTALLARPALDRLGLRAGDALALGVGGRRRTVTVLGTLVPRDELSARALDSLLVTDIATAQELLDAPGRLSRIDLIVPEGAPGEALLDRVRPLLPEGVRVERAGARAEAVERMTRAFHLNLSALSLLALVVGTFLVYNAMTFSVVTRRELFGVLRALGVTRGEVFGLVLGEALLVGAAATALGLPLGVVLGEGLVRLVARTINDLYVSVSVTGVAVPPLSFARAVALGLAGTLLAAVPAALEATTTAPRQVLTRSTIETRARRAAPGLALAGVGVVAAGATALAVPSSGLGLAYVGLFAVLVGAALLVPAVAVAAMAVARPVLGRLYGVTGRLAVGGVVQSLSRTSVALAALAIALAATVGVGVMVASFRSTVERWLATSLPADVYVSAAATVSSRTEATLDPRLVADVAAAPGVARVSALRAARLPSSGGSVVVLALSGDDVAWGAFSLADGDAGAVRTRVQHGGAVMVSEPFAHRWGLGVGDRVRLVGGRGPRELPIAAVYHDYGSTEGAVLMSRATYDALADDPAVTSLAVYAAPGVDADDLALRLRRRAGPDAALAIRSNRALREASLVVFDRTFAITVVLRCLAVAVAFIGVLSALTALGLERAREIAVLRAQGLTPREVWGLVTVQSGLMGLVAGLLALPIGLALAVVLVRVVNQRSFGWTLPLEVGPGVLVQAVALAVAAAVLAGAYPAYRLGRAALPAALRDE